MTRQETIQKLFDEFSPFIFKKSEKREILQSTLEEYQPFLLKLEKAKKCSVRLESSERNSSIQYEIHVNEGLKKFIYMLIEFDNKCTVDSSAHATEGALLEEEENRMNQFFFLLFNRRLRDVFAYGGIADDQLPYYRFDQLYLDGENVLETLWFDEDEEFMRFELIDKL